MKLILTKQQEDMLTKALTTSERLDLYTNDLKKIGYFSNYRYQARNRTNLEPKDFHRIFFKFSQPFKKRIKS